jgi:uncharacterized protein
VITDHAIYTGEVWHRRERPVVHAFRYPFWWLWLNLDDIDGLLARSSWWGRRWRPGVVSERDYLDRRAGNLSARVRTLAAHHGLDWHQGTVCLLSQPRLFGWLFNPLSLYWHFPEGAARPDSVLAEVRNTPWHETHWYPLTLLEQGGKLVCEHPKVFHVSPFMGMDMHYQWELSQNDRDLSVIIRNVTDQGPLFSAGVRLTRQHADGVALTKMLRQHGAQGMKTSLAIYAHAWRLWRKGVGFHAHPGRVADTTD